MNASFVGLLAAAILLAVAIAKGRQSLLMAAVMAYAVVVSLIIHRDLGMLMPALGIAIGLGLMGLAKVVWREVSTQEDTSCRILPKMSTSSRQPAENIGS